MADAPFLKGNPATSASAPSDAQKGADRPQKEGGSNKPDGSDEKRFPNRAQPMKETKGNPESIPSGGKLPFPGPSKPTATPFKLGK